MRLRSCVHNAFGLQCVGEQESSRNTVNVRTRDNQRRGEHPLESVLQILEQERLSRQGPHSTVTQAVMLQIAVCSSLGNLRSLLKQPEQGYEAI